MERGLNRCAIKCSRCKHTITSTYLYYDPLANLVLCEACECDRRREGVEVIASDRISLGSVLARVTTD